MGGKNPSYWFVGASYGGTDDQTTRFLQAGIWENGYEDKYLDIVRAMQPGERIAIKATYTKKHGLPFDSRGLTVSVMAIKAIGMITENPGDGRQVKVDWTPIDSPKLWYFYTYQPTIWRIQRNKWAAEALIDFTFAGATQDIDRFRNAPYWAERFGDVAPNKRRFGWTTFYEAIADKLLDFRNNRSALVAGIRDIAGRVDGLGHLADDKYVDGTTGFVRDICPFTTIGLFNRGISNVNRKVIATELAKFLGVTVPLPTSFEGIPVLNNLKSWYFGFENVRPADHIDALWNVFATGIRLADSADAKVQDDFGAAFDSANGRRGVAWNLTFGLYWVRPWSFLSLDSGSQSYITKALGIPIGLHGPKKRCNAADYLTAMDILESKFQDEGFPVHSFPELSLAAWNYKEPEAIPSGSEEDDGDAGEASAASDEAADLAAEPYSIDDILADGCFMERVELERLIDRLRAKKNLILQGPPGTGKTWLAKRLAFALIGQRDHLKLRAVQFHPNLSYEDFVRGWRPSGDGKLSLVDGAFMEAVEAARGTSHPYVVVIEEINRGNPAQIFGEMLTLLEADKRSPHEALELCYRRKSDERIYIPDNLYVIGTMNIADRSLALVDLALRRRFAFVDLEPRLGQLWRNWLIGHCGIAPQLVDDIEHRIVRLNAEIAADSTLGRQFRIGHSYVTPPVGAINGDAREWFRQMVATEIGPLLEEYWFDALDKARAARQRLVEGL
ncbi:AAA family ATPase [Polaromonas sp.]|uniref:AAA family ATPase n=1 Tax=Polaromonas sp. TaxID=1869339 RepID=UPI0035642011